VLCLRNIAISPEDNEREFRFRYVPTCKLPGDTEGDEPEHGSRFCILQEPIKKGQYGKAMIQGTSPVKVKVEDEDHEYACLEMEEAGHLLSCFEGEARILWKEDGEGEVWAVVQFPVYDGQRILVINDSGETIKDGYACMIDGTDEDYPYAFNVNKPDADNILHAFAFNGPDLEAGEQRYIRLYDICRFRTADEDIEPGDFVGIEEDEWEVRKERFGWLALGISKAGDETFVICRYNGLTPVLKAVKDEEYGEIDVKHVDVDGEVDGEAFTLAVIPEDEDED
jgi:hypothetical protein